MVCDKDGVSTNIDNEISKLTSRIDGYKSELNKIKTKLAQLVNEKKND